jgi:hypothetical protein
MYYRRAVCPGSVFGLHCMIANPLIRYEHLRTAHHAPRTRISSVKLYTDCTLALSNLVTIPGPSPYVCATAFPGRTMSSASPAG